MVAAGLEAGITGRIDILRDGLALLSRHRTVLLALALSGLLHALLFWGLRTEVLSGSALFGLRSSSTVVRLVWMSSPATLQAGAVGKVAGGIRAEAARAPDSSRTASTASPEAPVDPHAVDQGAAQRLSSEATPLQGGPLPEPHYYFPDELSVKPQLLSDAGSAEPVFIPDILPLPVLVQLLIDEQGRVDKVTLGENFLSDIAKKYIMESFSSMKFSPGMLGPLAVKSQLQIVVNLDPTIPAN